jgi:hypothetical protein
MVRPAAVTVKLQLPDSVDLHDHGVDGPERDRSIRDVVLGGPLKLNRRRGGRVGCLRLPFRRECRAAGDDIKHRHEESHGSACPATLHLHITNPGKEVGRSHMARHGNSRRFLDFMPPSDFDARFPRCSPDKGGLTVS